FSRNRAPPSPLMRFRWGSNSSAPSMQTSRRRTSSRPESGMPYSRASFAVASDVGTPTIAMPARTRSPIVRTIRAAVRPVPRPTTMFGSTRAAARSATACLISSTVIFLLAVAVDAEMLPSLQAGGADLPRTRRASSDQSEQGAQSFFSGEPLDRRSQTQSRLVKAPLDCRDRDATDVGDLFVIEPRN